MDMALQDGLESSRAFVFATAIAACAALAPCDILQAPPPGGDQPFTPELARFSVRVTSTDEDERGAHGFVVTSFMVQPQ
jgi:hypothetical protein